MNQDKGDDTEVHFYELQYRPLFFLTVFVLNLFTDPNHF